MNRLALEPVMAGARPSEDLDAIRRDAKSPGDKAVIREIREAGSRTAS